MSVDFPTSYPANVPPVNKPVDVQTLQATFAMYLRNYGTEKEGSQTTTLLEVLRPTEKDEGQDRNQLRRDIQSYAERSDFSQIDKKLQNKSELRSGEMNTNYRNRLDRQETLQNDYREQVERGAFQQSTGQVDTVTPMASATPFSEVASSNELPMNWNHSQPQNSAPAIANANNQAPATNVAAPNSVPIAGQTNVVMPLNVNTPISKPTPTTPQSAPLQALTVFSPSGRFGQSQEKAEENEEEKDERDDEKPDKKKQPFAAQETIRLETFRPVRRNRLQQPNEQIMQSELSQIAGKPHVKPKEIEAESARAVKTMEEFLNSSAQNVVMSKKGETNQPDSARYLNRIAAACEAAAQFAPIRIKINMDHLGTLALRFYYKAERMALRFETPSKESAKFLSDHLDGLKTILSKRHVKIVDIEIQWDTDT
jgi:hypothetical protein